MCGGWRYTGGYVIGGCCGLAMHRRKAIGVIARCSVGRRGGQGRVVHRRGGTRPTTCCTVLRRSTRGHVIGVCCGLAMHREKVIRTIACCSVGRVVCGRRGETRPTTCRTVYRRYTRGHVSHRKARPTASCTERRGCSIGGRGVRGQVVHSGRKARPAACCAVYVGFTRGHIREGVVCRCQAAYRGGTAGGRARITMGYSGWGQVLRGWGISHRTVCRDIFSNGGGGPCNVLLRLQVIRVRGVLPVAFPVPVVSLRPVQVNGVLGGGSPMRGDPGGRRLGVATMGRGPTISWHASSKAKH